MSELGMDSRGDVRTAYEFKDIFDDIGVSHRPYRCPFCEVPYEDRCIVTTCVKAPHFKLPKGARHRHDCDGEPRVVAVTTPPTPATRVIVGDVDVPAALVGRRPPRRVGVPRDGAGAVPNEAEIERRRRLLASSENTLASKFTTSLLVAIVRAHGRLMKTAFEQTVAAGVAKGSPAYGATFRTALESHPLDLFGQKLNYRTAFLNSKLAPVAQPRIYSGTGAVRARGPQIEIADLDMWPKAYRHPDRIPFKVLVAVALPSDAPAAHVKCFDELTALAVNGERVRWWVYGVAHLDAKACWTVPVASLDHACWNVFR